MNWFIYLRWRQRPRRLAAKLNLDLAVRIRRLLVILLGLASLHVVAMLVFEQLPLQKAIWLTLTTLTTVGYGDTSAATPAGQFATILLLYLAGITLLAQLASDYIDYRMERRQNMLRGQWVWNMRDHLVIINIPEQDGRRYSERLIRQLRETPAFTHLPVQMLTTAFPDGLPPSLRDLGVVHHHNLPQTDAGLDAVAVTAARYVVVLTIDPSDPNADSVTFDIAHRVMERVDPSRTHVIVECVEDVNRPRFFRLGVQSLIRPIRAYPELVVRAIVAPGVERLLENLFTHADDYPQRYELALNGLSWGDLVARLAQQDFGTALAYIDHQDNVISNAPAATPVEGKALIVMVKSGCEPSREQVASILSRGAEFASLPAPC